MKRDIQLLIIDPQNDFCDLPPSWQISDPVSGERITPALPVTGAHADMLRLADVIQEGAPGVSHIVVTLDSHHRVDIAHPTFWQQGNGASVAPFTTITARQVREDCYRPRASSAKERAKERVLAYLDTLEAQERYSLMVWPVHCEIGTWGHNVHGAVRAAYNQWEEAYQRAVQVVYKGSNPWTEHYSALQAEVPDAADPDTQLNRRLIDTLDSADVLLIAGEASSHCVKATTEHLADNLPSGDLSKLVLITDCMSPVTGFEAQGADFFTHMRERGLRCATSAEALAMLQDNA